MNFVIFPMFFLSGALYPTEKLAAWLQPLVRLNPLTYGVDLMRHTLLAEEFRAVSRVEFEPIFDVGYLVVFTVVCLAFATKLFGREEHLSAMFLGGEARRKLVPRQVGAGRLRLPAPSGPLSGIVGREFKRAVRQRGRLASTFARPLLWLIAAGTGFAALIPGGDYETYLLPGIIGMVILFSCLLSALGSVHDRQFGPMRMLLVAPVPRGLVVFGKTLSSTLLGAAFAAVFSVLVVFFDIEVSFRDYLGFLGAALLCALALSSLGMLAASRIRKLEDFAVAMNFVIFPLFFFSGALYPAGELPGWMQPLVRLNPLTYGVDLMRQTLLHEERRLLAPAQFAAWLDVAYLGAFALVCLVLAATFFGREEHLAPMMLGGAARRLPRLKGSPRWRSSSTATTTR
jgi:ABC-2 type transport system permease protein